MSHVISLVHAILPQLQQNKMLEGQIENAQNYKYRKSQLQEIVNELKLLCEQGRLLQTHFEFKAQFSALYKAQKETKQLSDDYIQDPSAIIKIGDGFFSLWKQVIDEFKGILETTWENYKWEKIFHIDESEIGLLESFRRYQTDLDKVKLGKARLESLLGKTPPKDESSWQDLQVANQELRQAWERLRWDELPDSIVSFIKKSKFDGVSLEDYTPEVKDWLEKNNLIKNFRIKLIPKMNQ